jgi:cupin
MTDLLHDALEQLRLEGAIFFRSELTDAFAFESAPNLVADVLHPGAERVILFHIVASGSCWVAAADSERHWANEGDVIVMPYGDEHIIGGPSPAQCVSIMTLLEPPPWIEMPLVRLGGGGPRTDLVCGYLYSEDPLFDPQLRAFPPAFVVRVPPGAATSWVQASIRYALEENVLSNASPNPLSTRLPELVLIEVLRLHLASAPAADQGWIAALRDPVLAPALALLHGAPERRWTVADLASNVAVSRSNGVCTWRTNCSRRRSSELPPSGDESATTPRNRSVAPSSALAGFRRATGGLPVPTRRSRQGERDRSLVLASAPANRGVRRQRANQTQRRSVLGQDGGNEGVETACHRKSRQPTYQALTDAPVLPGVLDRHCDLGLARAALGLVARDGDDLVVTQRYERLPTVMVDRDEACELGARQTPYG